MGNIVNFSKLTELRAKTDRDLIRIAGPELERAIVVANLAGSTQSVFHASAATVYNRVKALLAQSPKATAELEVKLKELRSALDLVPGAMDHEGQQVYC